MNTNYPWCSIPSYLQMVAAIVVAVVVVVVVVEVTDRPNLGAVEVWQGEWGKPSNDQGFA
jgi:hypothetical protein